MRAALAVLVALSFVGSACGQPGASTQSSPVAAAATVLPTAPPPAATAAAAPSRPVASPSAVGTARAPAITAGAPTPTQAVPATSAPVPATSAPSTAPPIATPTARPTPSPAPLPTVAVGGIAFAFVAASGYDLYVEAGFGQTSQAQGAITTYVARVQTSFGRAFIRRPQVYLFTDAGYAPGVAAVFGGNAGSSSGLTFGDRIAAKGYQVVMHELTHVMIGQIARSSVPAWLNEGTAYLDHWIVDAPEYLWAARYRVASRAHLGTLPVLTSCAAAMTLACAVGVEMLRSDIGRTSFVRLFELIGAGATLDSAYIQVTGRPLADFVTGFPARSRSLASSYPGLALLPGVDYAVRRGLYWTLYGFPANSTATMTVAGTTNPLCGPSTQETVGADGATDSFCPVPRGTWTVEVRWAGGVITATSQVP